MTARGRTMSQAERSATRPCDEIETPDADILTAMVTLAGDAFVAAFSHSLEGSINLRDVAGDVRCLSGEPPTSDQPDQEQSRRERRRDQC